MVHTSNFSCKHIYVFIFLMLYAFNGLLLAQIVEDSFIHDDRTRSYKVFLPQNNQPDNMPVVFNLTGYTGTGQWIRNYSLMNNVADTAGFIVVYPEPVQPGFNSGIIDKDPPPPNVDDVGFIAELIDTLYAHYNIDRSRVYCCGFSNGAHMTQRLAYWAGHHFAAIASICGTMTDSTAVHPPPIARSIPILILNGTADQALPWTGDLGKYAIEEMLGFWIQNNNCLLIADTLAIVNKDTTDKCEVEKITYTDCSDSVQILFYKIIDGGHAWPGSNPDVTWPKEGNVNRDINANVEIWNFFKNYTNPYVTDIENNHDTGPVEFSLFQNYPNPFNPITTIEYQLPKLSQVDLSIYNVLGQKVATLVSDKQTAGTYKVEWDATAFSSGVYFYRFETDLRFIKTKKLIVLK